MDDAVVEPELPKRDTAVTRVRIGLIGGGGIADAHIRGYRAFAETVLPTAVADVVPEVARRRAAELGVPAHTDYRQMIAQVRLDAVDICLPHHLHAEAIITAAEAGLHVLCEKPLCLTLSEADSVRAAVEQNDVTLMCAHNQLFLPTVAKAVELVGSRTLGRLYEVRVTDCFRNFFDPHTMGWRASALTSGGGELIDSGYHPTYLMLELAGGAPAEVVAMLATHRLTFAEGEDSAQLLVRFDNGVVGQLATSWAFDPPPATERFSVIGEDGTLRASETSLTLTLNGRPSQSFDFPPVDTYVAEIGHFAASLIGHSRPLHTEREGIEVLQMLLAAYESARTRAIVPVHA
jgi:predicted dehydrogenase